MPLKVRMRQERMAIVFDDGVQLSGESGGFAVG
jgi:hypothetical protein